MDFDRASWFMAGLLIGNFLNTFTTVTLLLTWVVISNRPLPDCLGGYLPQDVLAAIFILLNVWISKIIPSRMKPSKKSPYRKSKGVQRYESVQDHTEISIKEIDEPEIYHLYDNNTKSITRWEADKNHYGIQYGNKPSIQTIDDSFSSNNSQLYLVIESKSH